MHEEVARRIVNTVLQSTAGESPEEMVTSLTDQINMILAAAYDPPEGTFVWAMEQHCVGNRVGRPFNGDKCYALSENNGALYMRAWWASLESGSRCLTLQDYNATDWQIYKEDRGGECK